jgi:4-hydroxy-4-methyl-2-oxoglutarate aldolase
MGTVDDMTGTVISRTTLDGIRQYDTCTIANAIEHFRMRLRNQGYTQPGLRCLTGESHRVLGFAATCRIRSADPPMTGGVYRDRTDWWGAFERLPEPRIAVIQNLDAHSGGGSSVGEVHAAILKAMGCEGVVTNGTVRDIPAIRAMHFSLFASGATVSHGYTHVVDYGGSVHIFGLEINPGDLLFADCHGVLSIPLEIANEIPKVAHEISARERRIVDYCRSPEFSQEGLLEII